MVEKMNSKGIVYGLLISLLLWALLILAAFTLVGCSPEAQQALADPNNPTVAAIEDTAEGAVGIMQALGAIWPALLPVGAAAGGVLGAYKRLKPKILESQKNSDKYFAAGESLVTILEDIKQNSPEIWDKVGPMIEDATASVSDIENAIRGFRHLPPKNEA